MFFSLLGGSRQNPELLTHFQTYGEDKFEFISVISDQSLSEPKTRKAYLQEAKS